MISIGILAILIFRMDKDLLMEMSHSIHIGAWAVAILFIFLQVLSLSWRWMLLINIGRFRMTYAESYQVTIASYIANILFIPTIGGMIVRIAMAINFGSSVFKAIFATGMDRMMTLAALALFSAIFLPSLGKYIETPLMRDISIFIGVMMIVIFVLVPFVTLFIINKLPEKILSKANFRSGVRYLQILFNNNKILAKILSLSLMGQMCFFIACFAVCYSIEPDLSFLKLMIVLPMICLVSSLPFSIGGWGVREGSFIFGLGLLGMGMEQAFTISVQIGLLSLLANVIISIPALFSDKIKLTEEKQKCSTS